MPRLRGCKEGLEIGGSFLLSVDCSVCGRGEDYGFSCGV